jgi:hypothetical protein
MVEQHNGPAQCATYTNGKSQSAPLFRTQQAPGLCLCPQADYPDWRFPRPSLVPPAKCRDNSYNQIATATVQASVCHPAIRFCMSEQLKAPVNKPRTRYAVRVERRVRQDRDHSKTVYHLRYGGNYQEYRLPVCDTVQCVTKLPYPCLKETYLLSPSLGHLYNHNMKTASVTETWIPT